MIIFDQAICFFCSEVIVREVRYDGDEGGDWLDTAGYAGCGHRAGEPHTPTDPNDER